MERFVVLFAVLLTPALAGGSTCIAPRDVPAGADADVDGDGSPDRIVTGYSDVTIYVRRGACFVPFSTITVGPVAFVHVIDKPTPGVRDLSIETWLFHGDRKRTRWTWSGTAYSPGTEEMIPGPRR